MDKDNVIINEGDVAAEKKPRAKKSTAKEDSITLRRR